MRTVIVALIMVMTLPAQAHTEREQEEWREAWVERAEGKITPKLMDEWLDFHARHLIRPVRAVSSPSPSTNRGMGTNVEQWRGLVANHFSDVDRALCLMKYESGGNPNATSWAGARGLLQVMPFWAKHLGLSPDALYDPATNIRVARYVYGQQGWWAWSPYKRGLCR